MGRPNQRPRTFQPQGARRGRYVKGTWESDAVEIDEYRANLIRILDASRKEAEMRAALWKWARSPSLTERQRNIAMRAYGRKDLVVLFEAVWKNDPEEMTNLIGEVI